MLGSASLWLLLARLFEAPPQPVLVVNDSACIDSNRLAARLEKLLRGRPEHFSVVVDARATDAEWTSIALKVTDDRGSLVLERQYRLNVADCPSVSDLLTLVLEQFFAGLPAEPWVPRRTLELGLRVAGLSEWGPLGTDGELGVVADFAGARHALTTSLLVRAAAPHEIGGGNFQDTTFMAGVGWRAGKSGWRNRLEMRAGSMLVSGYGFAASGSTWLPWLEGAESIEYQWGSGWATGLETSLCPLQHTAVTLDRAASQSISVFRAGLVLSMPLWSSKF